MWRKIPATRQWRMQLAACARHASCALGREAQLICWAPEVIMRIQSRQQLNRQILLAQRAHEMRHQPTRSESALWGALSRKQLGVAFRRQVVIGNRYIADFLAPSVKLVIEVDGSCHACRVVADARRDRVLLRLGYRVLHLDAELVVRQLPLAVAAVRKALQVLSSHGAP
jgi:very-short-patch-repair endonuclease